MIVSTAALTVPDMKTRNRKAIKDANVEFHLNLDIKSPDSCLPFLNIFL